MLYVFIEKTATTEYIVVSSVEPTDDNYDEVQSNSYAVSVPARHSAEAWMNVVRNVLTNAGAEVRMV